MSELEDMKMTRILIGEFIEGFKHGEQALAEKIKEWIEANRTYMEIEAGIGIYRDHFTSEDLIKFIDSGEWSAVDEKF